MGRRLREAEPATLVFAGVALLSAAALLYWLSDLTFWRDEWDFLLHRRGFNVETYLDPFVEHLLAPSIGAYQLTVAVFGMESAAPTQVIAVALFITDVVLLFVYLRRRVDGWLALAAVMPILFLGPSWDDLLFPFQMAFFGSIAGGIGALLALEARTRRGDVVATVLLAISLLWSGLGVPFVIMVFVDLALTRDRFRRAFVFVIPTALYAIWYLGWGREATTFISFHNLQTLIGYVADGIASGLSTLIGLAVPRDEMGVSSLDWGRPLLVVALGFGVWRVARVGIREMPARFWAVLAGLLSFWTLTGLNAAVFGQPTSGRYQLVGVVLTVMLAAELLRGVRVRGWVIATVLGASLLATLANLSMLENNARGLAGVAERQRAGLAALELTRDEVDPAFQLTEANSGVDYLGVLDAGSYFSAIDAHGSPAFTPAELAASSEVARSSADGVFAAALDLRLVPVAPSAGSSCGAVPLGGALSTVPIPPTGVVLHSDDARADVRLRRYATTSFPADLGGLRPGDSVELAIPADGSNQPWELGLEGTGTVEVCAR